MIIVRRSVWDHYEPRSRHILMRQFGVVEPPATGGQRVGVSHELCQTAWVRRSRQIDRDGSRGKYSRIDAWWCRVSPNREQRRRNDGEQSRHFAAPSLWELDAPNRQSDRRAAKLARKAADRRRSRSARYRRIRDPQPIRHAADKYRRRKREKTSRRAGQRRIVRQHAQPIPKMAGFDKA